MWVHCSQAVTLAGAEPHLCLQERKVNHGQENNKKYVHGLDGCGCSGRGQRFRRAVAEESQHTANLPGNLQRNQTLRGALPLRDSHRNHRWMRQRPGTSKATSAAEELIATAV